jgi:hypothetical protein
MHPLRRRFLASFTATTLALFGITRLAPAAAQYTPAPEISAKDALRDLQILKRALTALHPGLLRYSTAAQIDAEFAAAEKAVVGGSDRGQLYLLVSRIAASVRCGHTWASPYNQAEVVGKTVFDRADKLPITLRWVGGRALVVGSMVEVAKNGVKAGDELLAIDGRTVADISAALLPYLRADGNHAGADAKRLAQLDSDAHGGAMDRLFPLLFAPKDGSYALRVLSPASATTTAAARDVTVAAVKTQDRGAQLPNEKSDWQFRIDGDTATLTLPTFAFWRGDFKPNGYLAQRFDTLRNTPAVRFLIIDVRRNEGGDDGIGRMLMAHLLSAPFTQPGHVVQSAYERVPYDLARYLDTWDFGFFDRTGSVTKGPGRNWQLAPNAGRRIGAIQRPHAAAGGATKQLSRLFVGA